MILIIGSGFIGSELMSRIPPTERKIVSHTDDWKTIIANQVPSLVVNAAAINGQRKCADAGWGAVKAANVDLPVQIAETALNFGSKCLFLSTGAVYARPHSTPKQETEKRYAPNLYIKSKMKMEDAVGHLDAIVFRLPVILGKGYYPGDYLNRIRKWTWAQDCYTSLLYMQTLYQAVLHVARYKVKGIFNIADNEFQHVPSFVKNHYKKLPVWEDDQIPKSFTQTHLLDTTKARNAGILK